MTVSMGLLDCYYVFFSALFFCFERFLLLDIWGFRDLCMGMGGMVFAVRWVGLMDLPLPGMSAPYVSSVDSMSGWYRLSGENI